MKSGASGDYMNQSVSEHQMSSPQNMYSLNKIPILRTTNTYTYIMQTLSINMHYLLLLGILPIIRKGGSLIPPERDLLSPIMG
jgi:hypothetical protein